MVEFGGHRHEDTVEAELGDDVEPQVRKGLQRRDTSAQSKAQAYNKSAAKLAAGTGKLEGRLIKQEQRNTGNIKRDVYKQYLSAGKGWFTLPCIFVSILLTQGKH
jgi:ATP-binding cassette subfamily C (CFTR/MRP) protein 1